MHVRVCLYVYLYFSVSMFVCACACVCVYVSMYVCMHVRARMSVSMRVCARLCMSLLSENMRPCVWLLVYAVNIMTIFLFILIDMYSILIPKLCFISQVSQMKNQIS